MSLLAKAAAKALSERVVVPPVDQVDARARGIVAIQRAMAVRAAEKRRRRIFDGAAGFAAVCAAATAIVWARTAPTTAHAALVAKAPTLAGDAVTVTATAADADITISEHGDPHHALLPAAPVVVGSRIVAPPGAHAMLGFSTGTSLTLDGSDVTVIDARTTQKLELRDGALAAKVAHLESGHRFLVETPDAEVEVRGTTFRVTVVPSSDACADGNRTRVVVTEGVVVVRAHGAAAEDRVVAGASWPVACAASASSVGAVTQHPLPLPTAAALSASSLSAQNDLFADAMTAKRSGDKRRAVATLDELVGKYPRGPLAESAEAERLRLLRDVDPGRAKSEARAYLTRYPKGFARDEAQAILSP